MTAFSVAAAFALAVGKFLTAHTPAVRSKVSYLGKSADVSGLQHDRKSQGLPDAAHAKPIPIRRLELDSFLSSSERLTCLSHSVSLVKKQVIHPHNLPPPNSSPPKRSAPNSSKDFPFGNGTKDQGVRNEALDRRFRLIAPDRAYVIVA